MPGFAGDAHGGVIVKAGDLRRLPHPISSRRGRRPAVDLYSLVRASGLWPRRSSSANTGLCGNCCFQL